jgi:hypothetical protein
MGLEYEKWRGLFLPEDGGSRFLRNDGKYLPNCTDLNPRRQVCKNRKD